MRRIAPSPSLSLLCTASGALYWRNVNALVMQHLVVVDGVIVAASSWRSVVAITEAGQLIQSAAARIHYSHTLRRQSDADVFLLQFSMRRG